MKRRFLLSLAALSPGVVTITLHEFALSMAVMVLGLFGACSVAAAAVAMSAQINPSAYNSNSAKPDYVTLLVPWAIADLREKATDTDLIRETLRKVMMPAFHAPGFVTQDEQVAMVLAQVMARWGQSELASLTDDQLRELWLVERLMRSTPAEAGKLAGYFAAPNAMLTMRDRIATPVPA